MLALAVGVIGLCLLGTALAWALCRAAAKAWEESDE